MHTLYLYCYNSKFSKTVSSQYSAILPIISDHIFLDMSSVLWDLSTFKVFYFFDTCYLKYGNSPFKVALESKHSYDFVWSYGVKLKIWKSVQIFASFSTENSNNSTDEHLSDEIQEFVKTCFSMHILYCTIVDFRIYKMMCCSVLVLPSTSTWCESFCVWECAAPRRIDTSTEEEDAL